MIKTVIITAMLVEDIVTMKEFRRSFKIIDIDRSEEIFYEREDLCQDKKELPNWVDS